VQSRITPASVRAHRKAIRACFRNHAKEKLTALATGEASLQNLANRAIIIHGREDVIVPVEVAYRLSALLKHSELHVSENVVIGTQIEKRDRFLEVVMPFLVQ